MIREKDTLLDWRKRAYEQPKARVVLDLEADSLHRYQEKICLIQYADEHGACVIDPLAIEDMAPFYQWLKETEVWMHGADYDMCLFLRACNALPAMIWDTQTAARLLGFRQFGLAALVEHFYGVELSKTSQKADWARRPLSEAMITYALNDVKYMLGMADMLTSQLCDLGRYEWFVESCHHSMQKAMERHHAGNAEPWRIQGSGKLNRRGLAALRELWMWRDNEAKVWDKPSFMVCSNADLLKWSQALQDQLGVSPSPRFHQHRRERFLEVVRRFYLIDEDEYPIKQKHVKKVYADDFDDKVSALCELRDRKSEELNIEGSFLITRAIMEAIAEDEETGKAQLLNWQREALGL